MVVAWVLFPLVLLVVCTGCGFAVEWVAGRRLPGPLVPSVGLALVIVVATLTTANAATAPLTTAVVIVLAVSGYASSWRRVRLLRPEPFALAVALGVFAICAAPVVLSGNATFLGYFVDSDPAFHFVLISWLLAHGYDLTGVPAVSPSAVTNLLREYIGSEYPTGADVALGAVRPLVGQDVAWIYSPYLAVVMALGAVALHELLAAVVRSRPLRAACAFIAAQSGLAYAFYLESSIKEIVVTALITVTVVLVIELLRRPIRLRALAPLAIVAVAGLDVYQLTIVPLLGIPLAAFTVVAGWRGRNVLRRTPSWRTAAVPAAFALVLALAAPVISGASMFSSVASAVLTQQNVLGNLAGPLPGWEVLGIWPNGDFRFPALGYRTGYVLIGVALIAAVLGALWILRRRATGPLLLLIGTGVATVFLVGRASPYAASKVLMIFSVTAALIAMLGAAALHDAGRRVEGWLLAGAIATGVLWTNTLAYHDSSVAPQGRFRELAAIGAQFKGQGPAFYDLWDTYPVYFLRGASVAVPDTFAGSPPERPGLPVHLFGQPSTAWDLNDLQQSYVQIFRLLILGRSPLGSRPPADYQLVYRGRYYDVWQRMSGPRVISHIPFGDGGAGPSPVPSCHTITSTAALAKQDGARLAYVARQSLPTLIPAAAPHPPTWSPTAASGYGPPDFLSLGQSSGSLVGTVRVPVSGRYQVWLQGSLSRHVIVGIGGRLVGSVRHQIGTAGQFLQVGTVDLSAGDQTVAILRPPSYYVPGNVVNDMLGPLVLVHDSAPSPIKELAPSQARSLCGKPLQWLEIVS